LAVAAAALLAGLLAPTVSAQPSNAPARGQGQRAPQFVSPEVTSERKITFRILAPKAEAVRLNAGDIPNLGSGAELSKGSNNVWETTVGPVPAGAYRYTFTVDGVAVIDPRNPATSESNNNTWSLVVVPGADWLDTRDVPHGAVAAVTYFSKSLNRFRRLHVYTPPGYEAGAERYPVFYLLHGSGDSDDSWSSVGRAGVILDNLIAAGKAKPMVMVMPAGHTGTMRPGGPRPAADEFSQDFMNDIVPLIEQRYRVKTDRSSRALAGLSMGGGQTLTVGIPNLDKFAYLGVYSAGVFGIAGGGRGGPAGPSFEEQNKARLDDGELRKGLKLFWFATGKQDFLIETSRATVAMFKRHGFEVVFHETEGAHTWLNWRDYLNEFAPQLFQ